MQLFKFSKKVTDVQILGITHRGHVREKNEDYYKMYKESENNDGSTLLLLADGMGGYGSGDIASKITIEQFKKYYDKSKELNLQSKIKKAIQFSNEKVLEMATSNDSCHGMGSTIAVIVLYKDNAFIGNVGDSRIYLYREQKLVQLSEEHTWVKEVGIDEKEAKNHPNRHVISRSIGKDKRVKPFIKRIDISKYDKFLICSDGLTTHLSDKQLLRRIGSGKPIETIGKEMLKKALKLGGKDNITLILANMVKVVKSRRPNKIPYILIFLLMISILVMLFFYSDFLEIDKDKSPADTTKSEVVDTVGNSTFKFKSDSSDTLIND